MSGVVRGMMAWAGLWGAVVAGRLPADEPPLHVMIDRLVSAPAGGREPAPPADDAAFLRRVWLDLAGRIPSAAETRAFLADGDPDKRSALIDRLLAAPAHRQRMQAWFHAMLMERRGDHAEWQMFLQTCCERNLPWDALVAAILAPNEQDEALRGAAFFYAKRLESYGQNPTDFPGLTRDVGRLFLGVDLQCAECHNHLFIDDYRQQEFQGLYAVYKNLSIRGGVAFPAVSEKVAQPRVEFVSVFDATKRETGPRVPFGQELTWVELPPAANAKGPPSLSVLPALAQALPTAEHPLFAKNIANRLWFAMMGHGLVNPLDLFHAGNPPTHPELLEVLARELAAHRFDIRWFLRELALSQTYQRSSVAPDGPAPPRHSYSIANEKRLSAEQLLWSTLQATGNLERLTADNPAAKKELEDLKGRFLKAFANEPREPETDFHATVAGALFLLNDDKLLALCKPQAGNLVERLAAMSDSRALTDELFLSVFTREPTEEERTAIDAYLPAHASDRPRALGHLVWSMISSMEFFVNH